MKKLSTCILIAFFVFFSMKFIVWDSYAETYENNIESSIRLVGRFPLRNYPVADSFTGLQGSTIIGNKLYVTCSNNNKSSAVALLMEINLNTFALIRSVELPLYHANDITYNPDYNGKEVLIIPHTSTNVASPNTVSIVDISTFAILENKVLSKYVYNFANDKNKKVYIGFGDNNMYVFSNKFELITSYETKLAGKVPQGSEVYNESYIQTFTKQNSISIYDNKGKMIKKYYLSNRYGELESCISLGNGDFILGFNNATNNDIFIDFYKITLFKGSNI